MIAIGLYTIRFLFIVILPFTPLIETLIKKYLCDRNFEVQFFEGLLLSEQYKKVF